MPLNLVTGLQPGSIWKGNAALTMAVLTVAPSLRNAPSPLAPMHPLLSHPLPTVKLKPHPVPFTDGVPRSSGLPRVCLG